MLYLRGGAWKGKQVVPAAWVAESTESHSDIGTNRGYGYMWWTGPGRFASLGIDEPMFYAAGYRRQYAFVFPLRDLVIVHRINSDRTKTFPHWPVMEELMRQIFEGAPKPG